MSFEKVYAFTQSWEGFISDDPDDVGKFTYRGISRQFHPNWEGWQYVDLKQYDEADILVPSFYKAEFWDKAECDKYEDKLGMALFDTSVNMGISKAKSFLNDTEDWRDFLFKRIARHCEVAKYGNNIKWLRGWLNRTLSLYKILKNGG